MQSIQIKMFNIDLRFNKEIHQKLLMNAFVELFYHIVIILKIPINLRKTFTKE